MTDETLLSTLVVLFLLLCFVPPVVALIAMRRTGKGWARTRIISYSVCSVLYTVNTLLILGSGKAGGAALSGAIAFSSGRGALRAWRAWQVGDWRPAHLRKETGPDRPSQAAAA